MCRAGALRDDGKDERSRDAAEDVRAEGEAVQRLPYLRRLPAAGRDIISVPWTSRRGVPCCCRSDTPRGQNGPATGRAEGRWRAPRTMSRSSAFPACGRRPAVRCSGGGVGDAGFGASRSTRSVAIMNTARERHIGLRSDRWSSLWPRGRRAATVHGRPPSRAIRASFLLNPDTAVDNPASAEPGARR